MTYSPSVSCQFTYTSSQLVTYRDPNLKNWTFGYSSSKLSSFTDPLSHGVTVSYPSSSRTQVQTSLGNSWSYDYSVAGLVSRITDPFGYQTDLSYNNDSTLTSVTNAKGQKTSYAWDSRYLSLIHI